MMWNMMQFCKKTHVLLTESWLFVHIFLGMKLASLLSLTYSWFSLILIQLSIQIIEDTSFNFMS